MTPIVAAVLALIALAYVAYPFVQRPRTPDQNIDEEGGTE